MNNLKTENFYIISFSYKNLNLEEREDFIRNGYKDTLEEYFQKNRIKGYVALETCLRIEIYMETESGFVIQKFLEKTGTFNAQIYKNSQALKYLFTVVCGLDSVIKGEDQILSQIKRSYQEYMEKKKTSKLLNIIFNKAIETGKKFRTISEISKNNLSLDSIAVKFIKSKFSDLENKKIFIIGVGELSQDILAILYKLNKDKITMTNRSKRKSFEVQKLFEGVKTAEFSMKYEIIKNSDIVISATSAPHLVLRESFMRDILNDGKERFFLDLAVPRDIDNQLKKYKNVTLFHLEDIWAKYNKNIDRRNNIAEDYYYVIEEHLKKLEEKLRTRSQKYNVIF